MLKEAKVCITTDKKKILCNVYDSDDCPIYTKFYALDIDTIMSGAVEVAYTYKQLEKIKNENFEEEIEFITLKELLERVLKESL